MSIAHNSSNEQVSTERKLYTGVTNFKVTAVNPTMDEMKALGMNPKNDPSYFTQVEGENKKLRIDLYIQANKDTNELNAEIKTKISFWLENAVRTNKDGNKSQFINKKGQVAWPKGTEETPTYEWYSKEGLRKAYIGEEFLIPFIQAWANVKQDDNCGLDTITKIVEGDVTELKTLVEVLKSNAVRVLLGVKDGQYQSVYTKFFDRPYNRSLSKFQKALEGEYGAFKDCDYQDDLHLREYLGGDMAGSAPTDMGATAGAAPNF
jgi:hypothetical protein